MRQPDEPLAATHSEDTDVVRLMTVHQSKGLEFPIVFVPDMNRPAQNRAPSVHTSMRGSGRWCGRRPATTSRTGSPADYDLWRYAEAAEEAAETNRLLYVATTRAADYLVLSSGVQQRRRRARSPGCKLLARRFDLVSGPFHRPVARRRTTAAP